MWFKESLKLDGDPAGVWRRASTIEDIPKYWHGTRSLDVLSKGGGRVWAKVRFAFGGTGEADISVNEEKRTLTIDYKSGPFTGRQVVAVEDGGIAATWDVKFRGIFRVASKWNGGHFKSGTVHALERLAGRDGA